MEIDAQRAQVRRAQAEFQKAQSDFNRIKRLLEGNSVSKTEYDDAALILRQCGEQLSKDQFSQQRLEADLPIQQDLARAELQSAQAVLSRNRLSTQVESLQRSLQLAEARLEKTIIRAPVTGEILKIELRSGETLGNQPILRMGNTRSMFVTAEVYETDVRHVRSGQTAQITSPAFGERLSGRVERVSSLVHKNDLLQIDPTADTDARVIEVLIRLDESSVAARYNHHQVDVEINIGHSAASSPAAGDSAGGGATALIP